jgi:hypothetical protein
MQMETHRRNKSIIKTRMTSYEGAIFFIYLFIYLFFCHRKDNTILGINKNIQSPLFKDLNFRVFSGESGCLVVGDILLLPLFQPVDKRLPLPTQAGTVLPV